MSFAPEEHPDIDGMTEAIRNGDLDGVISRLGNVLETVTIRITRRSQGSKV